MNLKELILEINAKPWRRVSTIQFALFSFGCLIFALLLKNAPDNYLRIVDDANLLFHEAGHPIFGLLGDTIGLYGGTLGQLAFPLILTCAFWGKREPIGFSVMGIWFFENWLNIARYMADARAQVLPLVGGGEHDWTNIFSRWNALNLDTSIAKVVGALGWIGMFLVWIWFAWHWYLRHETNSNSGRSYV